MSNVYVIFEAAGLAEEEDEEEEEKQLTADEYETEEIRRDEATMARLQEGSP
ncbi:hypothetical protein RMATCC62417_15460 [Rhizopus microsporus]|nr:hypothetical protein RMATCC62417_15460 [Rhizopus microsporus]